MLKNVFVWVTFLFLLVAIGCSPFGQDEVTEENDVYQTGVAFYKQKNYNAAIKEFRKLPPESPNYKRALTLIQKIPMQQAEDAFAKKDYNKARSALNRISRKSPDYAKARQFNSKITYLQALEAYEKERDPQKKISALEHLIDVASASRNQVNLLHSVEQIGVQLQQASRAKEIDALIALLSRTMMNQEDIEILQLGLEQSYLAFDLFQSQPQFRGALLRVIATIKYRVQ